MPIYIGNAPDTRKVFFAILPKVRYCTAMRRMERFKEALAAALSHTGLTPEWFDQLKDEGRRIPRSSFDNWMGKKESVPNPGHMHRLMQELPDFAYRLRLGREVSLAPTLAGLVEDLRAKNGGYFDLSPFGSSERTAIAECLELLEGIPADSGKREDALRAVKVMLRLAGGG